MTCQAIEMHAPERLAKDCPQSVEEAMGNPEKSRASTSTKAADAKAAHIRAVYRQRRSEIVEMSM